MKSACNDDTRIVADRSLWVGHPASSDPQQSLPFAPGGAQVRPKRRTQADVLLSLLRAAHAQGEPLELPSIMKAGLAQHSARILELRRRGFQIKNEMTRTDDGTIRSTYELLFDPEERR
jgi:Helix-turn-helix domain